MSQFFLICLLVALPLVSAQLPADTANDERTSIKDRGSTESPKPNLKATKITREREAAALTFAKQHHPELLGLLDYLREKSPTDYRRALHDLFQSSERIAQFQDRGETDRYELELKLWQVQSRIQLLAARIRVGEIRVGETRGLYKNLEAALNDELTVQIQIRQLMRDKVAQRVSRLDEQISRLVENRRQEVERKARFLTRTPSGNPRKAASESSPESTAPTPSTQDAKNR
jgi:hypothetical protein